MWLDIQRGCIGNSVKTENDDDDGVGLMDNLGIILWTKQGEAGEGRGGGWNRYCINGYKYMVCSNEDRSSTGDWAEIWIGIAGSAVIN